MGNMNNNFFCTARYLRDRGYDAHLFLLNEYDHFLPSADSYTDDFKAYTTILHWSEKPFWEVDKEEIRNTLAPYDFLIACDYAPAYIEKGGRKVNIFIPHGTDLYEYPFKKGNIYYSFNPLKMYYNVIWWIRRSSQFWAQRKAIEKSDYVHWEATNPEWENRFASLHINRVKISMPFIYTPQYRAPEWKSIVQQSAYYNAFKKIRDSFGTVIFHQSRQMFKSYPDFDKGNDILIKGFAEYIRETSNTDICLVMLEYGIDVNESKKLITELGIENNVRWLPKMYRKDIMVGISMCDIGVGQLKISALTYGSICEFLAMGKPTIHHCNAELYKNHYKELYPTIDARTPEQVKQGLKLLIENKAMAKEMGEKGQAWFDEYVIKQPVERIIYAIEEFKKKKGIK